MAIKIKAPTSVAFPNVKGKADQLIDLPSDFMPESTEALIPEGYDESALIPVRPNYEETLSTVNQILPTIEGMQQEGLISRGMPTMAVPEITEQQPTQENTENVFRGISTNYLDEINQAKKRMEKMPLETPEGIAKSPQEVAQAVRFETESQAARLPIQRNDYDYVIGQTVFDAKDRTSSDPDKLNLQTFAIDFTTELGRYGTPIPLNSSNQSNSTGSDIVPENVTSLDFFANQAQVPVNYFTNAMIEESLNMFQEVVRKNRKETNTDFDPEANMESLFEAALEGEDISDLQLNEYQKAMNKEDAARRISSKIKKNIRNKKKIDGASETNSALDGLNDLEFGGRFIDGLINTGYLQYTDNGNKVVLTQKGVQTYQKGYQYTKRQDSSIRGGGAYTYAPFAGSELENSASYTVYNKFGLMDSFRPKNFPRYKSDKDKTWTNMYYPNRYNAILGRSAYTTSESKLSNNGLVWALYRSNTEYADKAGDFLNIGPKEVSTLSKRKKSDGSNLKHDNDSISFVLRNESQQALNTFEQYVYDYENGMVRRNPHRMDTLSGRSYGEDYDIGWQGNHAARALTANSKKLRIKVSESSLDSSKPNSFNQSVKEGGQAFFNQIERLETELDNTYNSKNPLSDDVITLFSLVYQKAILDPMLMSNGELNFKGIARSITYENILNHGNMGRALRRIKKEIGLLNNEDKANIDLIKSLYPQVNPETGKVMMDPNNPFKPVGNSINIPSLNPNNPNYQENKTALDFIFSRGADHKNYGEMLGALEDAASYLDALEGKEKFYRPEAVGSTDMTMAGAAIIAYKLGDIATIAASGMYFDIFTAERIAEKGMSSIPDPRIIFAQQMVSVLNSDYFDDQMFNAVTNSYRKEDAKKEWQKALKTFTEDPNTGKVFAKALAKIPKMTTVYGRPSMSHFDSMRSFLEKGIAQPLIDQLAPYYQVNGETNLDAMAFDLKDIVHFALLGEANRAVYRFVKDAANSVGLFGKLPKWTGVFGNLWELGSVTQENTGEPIVLKDDRGNISTIYQTKSVINFGGAKAPKEIPVYNPKTGEVKPQTYTPENFSDVALQALPQMGHAFESEIMTAIANEINPNINNPGMFISVFDNIASDMEGLARAYTAGNLLGKNPLIKKVLDHNPFETMVQNFRDAKIELHSEMKRKVANKEMVNIGRKGEYSGITFQGDNTYKHIEDMKKDGTWNQEGNMYWTRYYTEQMKAFKAMGYKNPEERGGENAEVLIDPSIFLPPNYVMIYRRSQIKEKGFQGDPIAVAPFEALDTFTEAKFIATGLKKPKSGKVSSGVKDFQQEFDNMQYKIKTRSKEKSNFWKIGL